MALSALPKPPHRRLPWPAPALLAWLGAWLLLVLLHRAGLPLPAALAAATAAGALAAVLLPQASRWRRGLVALGFPVSALCAGLGQGGAAGGGLPAWLWLLPLGLLLLAYPVKAWRDAPLFPTPADALAGAARQAALPTGARVLDAGCGLGHGLGALRAEWPQARVEGIEWSWPLRLACGLRCRWAQVQQGDMWAAPWQGYALVYLFQRPESMPRAWAKACAEMAPGSWLLSLDFAVPDVTPQAVLRRPGRQPVWLYRVPAAPAPQPAASPADNPGYAPAAPGRVGLH